MKKLLIILSSVIAIYLIGLLGLNSHAVQDRLLNTGLQNIVNNTDQLLFAVQGRLVHLQDEQKHVF